MLENSWLTVTEAAQLIGCSGQRIRVLATAARIKSIKVGPRAWLIDRSEAEEMRKNPPKTGRPRKNKKNV